eukprot:6194803-Pleurochrysis_carterae.AAC.2
MGRTCEANLKVTPHAYSTDAARSPVFLSWFEPKGYLNAVKMFVNLHKAPFKSLIEAGLLGPGCAAHGKAASAIHRCKFGCFCCDILARIFVTLLYRYVI